MKPHLAPAPSLRKLAACALCLLIAIAAAAQSLRPNAANTRPAPDELAEHFRANLGNYPFEIAFFSDPGIQPRLEDIMGADNFDYLAYMFQSQTPIEYHSGMYWAGGFIAHQCCDPYAIWAYDTRSRTFHVYIRKDDRDHWWTESPTLPYEFQELVRSAL